LSNSFLHRFCDYKKKEGGKGPIIREYLQERGKVASREEHSNKKPLNPSSSSNGEKASPNKEQGKSGRDRRPFASRKIVERLTSGAEKERSTSPRMNRKGDRGWDSNLLGLPRPKGLEPARTVVTFSRGGRIQTTSR